MIKQLFKIVKMAAVFSKLMNDFGRLQIAYVQTPHGTAERDRIWYELYMRKQHLLRIQEAVPREIHEPGNNYKTPIPV